MSKKLFDDDSDDSGKNLEFGTNEDYAKSYNNFRKKELLKKYKDRGLELSESELSTDSDSTDEDEVVNPEFDQEFFQTLASLKSKDPKIYDKETRFFEQLNANVDNEHVDADDDGDDIGNDTNINQKLKKTKPITLKDYERNILLEKGADFVEDNDEDQRIASPTIVEEERRLKAEFKQVLNAADSEDEEFGGIFKKRKKTQQEKANEEADYAKWLAGKKEDIAEQDKAKLAPLKNYWNSERLTESEKFLRDYILNKGYADTKSSEIPTYDEIVGNEDKLSEDEQELEKQAEFEQKYNFRYEEPDADFIRRYPRTIENSLRRTDDKRKKKRQELKERKQQDKDQKMRELEMIKEMKRKEIEERIQKLKMVTGNEELGFKDEELEEDFDPEAHDRRMQEIFNDEYYQVDEGDEKPECPSDIEELKVENWDNYDPERGIEDYDNYEPHCEDDDFNMDCEYDPVAAKEQLQKELIENTKRRKGRRGRRNRFMEMIQADKPPFKPEDEKTYAEYIDEYYKIDCEDIIDDLPCRFKYVETTPNDFGLTIEEILLAKNKELNQWASLKKAIQLRPEQVEKKEQRLYKLKAKNEELKRKIFKSIYGEGSDNEDEAEVTEVVKKELQNTEPNSNEKKKKNKRKRKSKATENSNNNNKNNDEIGDLVEIPAKKSKQENEEEKVTIQLKVQQTNETTTNAENVNKKKKKKNKKQNATPTNNNTAEKTQPKQTNPFSGTKLANKNNAFARKNVDKNLENKFKEPNELTVANKTGNKHNPFKDNKFKTNNSLKMPPLCRNGGKNFVNKNKTKFNKFNKNAKSTKTTMTTTKTKMNDAKISDERLKAYGINPKKFHKKQKYGNSKETQDV